MPCADEVGRLQRGGDAECDLFLGFCEEGHYGGRTNENGSRSTRQGIYAVTPSGRFLGSINTQDADKMRRMLEGALDAWRGLPKGERTLDEERAAALRAVRRPEARRPDGALTLRVTVRDLPRDRGARGWLAGAWNQDFAWLSVSEAKAFVPAEPEIGAECAVPRATLDRLARLHLVDIVRGQSPGYGEGSVERAELTSVVEARDGACVKLALRGSVRVEQKGRWSVGGARDGRATEQIRGVELELLGKAEFDVEAARLTALEIVALGGRWGGTRYNMRGRDLERAGIGFVIALEPDEAACEVAPASFWDYAGLK